MDDTKRQLNRLEDKVDDVNKHLGSIDSTLSAQHVSLQEHMRRSQLLEEKMEPVEKHVAMVAGAIKLIGILAMIAAIIEGIKALK